MTVNFWNARRRIPAAVVAVCLGVLPAWAADQLGQPEDPDQLNRMGVTSLTAGRFLEAIEYFQRATEIKPDEAYVQNLSIAMNNLAVQNMADTKTDQAITLLSQAFQLFPNDMIAKNLADAFVQKGNTEIQDGRQDLALQYYRDAAKTNPNSGDAHRKMADILYETGRLSEALESIDRARKIKDSPYLKRESDKIRKELEGEKNFFEHRGLHFRIFYSPTISPKHVADGSWAMEQAYQEHRMFLGDAPKAAISAVFYASTESFTSTHDLTQNVAGLYDGKVRLPVPENPDWKSLQRTVSHEVAHAFLYDVGGPKIPYWLNEGFAEFLSSGQDRQTPSLNEARRKGETLIPLRELSDALRNAKNNTRALLAYDQAYAIAKFINERFGVFGARRLLQAIRDGIPEDEAIQQALFMSPEMLQQSWESRLR